MNSLLSPFHLTLAFTPLAVYLLSLAVLNLGRRPFMTTGGRDLFALAVGMSGFVAAGPMELFMPMAAANQFGAYVWLLMLTLYALSVLLAVLLMRPRIVIYNCTLEQVRPLMANCVAALDPDFRWAGECLSLPHLGVQLHVQANRTWRNVQLTGIGSHQSLEGWRQFYFALRREIRATKVYCSPWAPVFLLLALGMLLVVGNMLLMHPKEVAEGLRETFEW
jgi:hypothetical protein